MFSFAYQEQGDNYVIESREFEKIKQRLLFSLTNFGKPWIYVVDGNYRNRGELLLRHEHNGIDLKLDKAADTLANVQAIWSRPVGEPSPVRGRLRRRKPAPYGARLANLEQGPLFHQPSSVFPAGLSPPHSPSPPSSSPAHTGGHPSAIRRAAGRLHDPGQLCSDGTVDARPAGPGHAVGAATGRDCGCLLLLSMYILTTLVFKLERACPWGWSPCR